MLDLYESNDYMSHCTVDMKWVDFIQLLPAKKIHSSVKDTCYEKSSRVNLFQHYYYPATVRNNQVVMKEDSCCLNVSYVCVSVHGVRACVYRVDNPLRSLTPTRYCWVNCSLPTTFKKSIWIGYDHFQIIQLSFTIKVH